MQIREMNSKEFSAFCSLQIGANGVSCLNLFWVADTGVGTRKYGRFIASYSLQIGVNGVSSGRILSPLLVTSQLTLIAVKNFLDMPATLQSQKGWIEHVIFRTPLEYSKSRKLRSKTFAQNVCPQGERRMGEKSGDFISSKQMGHVLLSIWSAMELPK